MTEKTFNYTSGTGFTYDIMTEKTFNYTSGTGFTYDNTKIEISAGARLKLNNTALSFIQNFTNDTGFTYDNTKAEFTGGVCQQKSQRLSDATFGVTYTSSINGSWGDGVLTGTGYGGASVLGGKLDLAHNDLRYVKYAAAGNILYETDRLAAVPGVVIGIELFNHIRLDDLRRRYSA
jgi:hypothetical protein